MKPRRRPPAWLPVLAALLGATACQSGTTPPSEVVRVSPAVARVLPGQQVQFTATSPWGSDVIWSVQPASEGTIDPNGLFTASLTSSDPSAICTVVATLRSDPGRVGLAVVTLDIQPPVNMVAASGRRQTADGVEVESVVLEPVGSAVSRDATGAIENRAGFYPSGNPGNPGSP